MKPLVATATAAALVLGLATAAHAGNTRVVVAGSEADPIASRLEKELGSMGFEPVRVDDATACSRDSVAAWLEDMHATGVACSDGVEVSVWVSGPAGLRMADLVTPLESDGGAKDLVAVRAAEVARASLELPSSEPPAATPPNQPPPWTTAPTTPGADTARKRSKRPAGPNPYTPALALGAGIGAVVGADSTLPALELEFEVRVVRSIAIATRGDIPLSSTTIPTPRGLVKVAPAVFAIGPIFNLASADSFLVPRLGTGIGFVWLRSEAPLNPFAATEPGQSTFQTPGRDDLFSPMAYANAALSMRVAGPVRLAFDGMVGTTAHRMVVRDQGTHVAYWGQPFGAIAMRGEAVFR